MKTRFTTIIIALGVILLFSTSVAFAADDILAPGWKQVNQDGFGDPRSWIQSLEVFNGYLYAGTWASDTSHEFDAQVWRTNDGENWSQVSPSWSTYNGVVWDMIEFNDQIYIGTTQGELWRSSDGESWENLINDALGDSENGFRALAVFSNTLFIGTDNRTTGIEIWSSATGDAGDWTQVNTDGFGNGATTQDVTMDIFNGFLYVGFGRTIDAETSTYLAELWRSNDGVTWAPVFTDGLGKSDNSNVSSMEEYNGYFYIGFRNVNTGGEVWRSTNGTDWTVVFANGNADPDNQRPYGLTTFNDCLYLTMINASSGAEVWESTDGLSWQVIANNGWGDAGNFYADYFDNGSTIFKGGLYIGTLNSTTGGEIWAYQPFYKSFLPFVVK